MVLRSTFLILQVEALSGQKGFISSDREIKTQCMQMIRELRKKVRGTFRTRAITAATRARTRAHRAVGGRAVGGRAPDAYNAHPSVTERRAARSVAEHHRRPAAHPHPRAGAPPLHSRCTDAPQRCMAPRPPCAWRPRERLPSYGRERLHTAQVAKFLMWVEKNQTSMNMLNTMLRQDPSQ
jgi:hypothetical protein